MKLAITGATGLIGWHLRVLAESVLGWDVVVVGRDAFSSVDALAASINGVDAIAHVAGANRGPDAEVAAQNVSLATTLVAALDADGQAPCVVFTNSTKAPGPSAYGESKADASRLLSDWAAGASAAYVDLVLPHVFGEHGRPFHNSVVSTFCYQLAHGETPNIIDDGELELLHAQDVADAVVAAIEARTTDVIRPRGAAITVSELLDRLRHLAETYDGHEMPNVDDHLDLALFNTYRSYLFPQAYPQALTLATDNRGGLVECIRSHGQGQAFLSTTHPGITRGNHFHRRKIERFVVVSGQATIELRRLGSDDRTTFTVSGDAPAVVDIPTLHTHNITNVGSTDLTTIFWANELFDPEHPDTYAELV